MTKHESHQKLMIYIPFSSLPDGKDWGIGQIYRVKMVLKQTKTDEKGATFELIDATSLEIGERSKRLIDKYNE